MRISEIRNIIEEKIQEALQVCDSTNPDIEGSLIVRKKKEQVFYYNKEEYLSKKKTDVIKLLERKNYNAILRKSAEKNIKLFRKIESELDRAIELDDVYFNIPKEKRHLIDPFYHNQVDKEFTKKWLSTTTKVTKDLRKTSFRVSNGVKVRSKSELIIAERLIASGVPFYYEHPVAIDYYEIWFPDFLVLNKRTKREYYWEHFGMINDAQYSANMQQKVETYARNGIVLGKNLIISFEGTERPIDTEFIDKIIEQFLL